VHGDLTVINLNCMESSFKYQVWK